MTVLLSVLTVLWPVLLTVLDTGESVLSPQCTGGPPAAGQPDGGPQDPGGQEAGLAGAPAGGRGGLLGGGGPLVHCAHVCQVPAGLENALLQPVPGKEVPRGASLVGEVSRGRYFSGEVPRGTSLDGIVCRPSVV